MSLPSTIDSVFRLVNREIWIITAAAGDRRGGLTATWFAEASLDRQRPVVLAGIAPNHYTADLLDASGSFAAHLLTPQQASLAVDFALGSGRERDKLASLATSAGRTGSPILRSLSGVAGVPRVRSTRRW